MAGKRFIRSNLPLGSSFPGGPYEKDKEKLVSVETLQHPIIKTLIQSGDIIVVDYSQKVEKESVDLQMQMSELQKQLAEAQEKLAVMEAERAEVAKAMEQIETPVEEKVVKKSSKSKKLDIKL